MTPHTPTSFAFRTRPEGVYLDTHIGKRPSYHFWKLGMDLDQITSSDVEAVVAYLDWQDCNVCAGSAFVAILRDALHQQIVDLSEDLNELQESVDEL